VPLSRNKSMAMYKLLSGFRCDRNTKLMAFR
jgi:hypothetical protein